MRRTCWIVIALTALLAAAPSTSTAQSTWLSGWAGMLMDPGNVRDFESGTRWDLGTSFMAGAGVQRLVGEGLVAGLELGYSPVRHEVREMTSGGTVGAVTADGRAHVVTAMLTGRLGGVGGGGFGTYLAGGIGAMVYGIPSLDRWDPDLALRAGGGVEYRRSAATALYVEWNRWWVFHQSEGVQDNTVRHGSLVLGARISR